MNYWLVKTEPDVYSIDCLRKDKLTFWDAVRNYQARNYLKTMQKDDLVFIYHSNAQPTGIAGLAVVVKTAIPDQLQFIKSSNYYDPKATPKNPRWFSPELKFKEKFKALLPLSLLKEQKALKNMQLLKRGNRLSVLPVHKLEADCILKLTTT